MKWLKYQIIILLILVINGFSQSIELANVVPSFMPNVQEKNSGNHLDISYLTSTSNIPLLFSETQIGIVGLTYNQLNVSDVSAGGFAQNISVKGFELKMGLVSSINKRFKLYSFIFPKIYGNLDFINFKKDLKMDAILLVERIFSENLKLRLGLCYKPEYYGDYFLPIFGIDWKINNDFLLEFSSLGNGAIKYLVNPWFNYGIALKSYSNSYKLDDQKYVYSSSSDFLLFSEFIFFKTIIFTPYIGYSFINDLDVYNKNETISFEIPFISFGDNRSQLNNKINNGLIFMTKLAVRISK